MKKITKENISITLNEETLSVSMTNGQTDWSWKSGFQPRLVCEEGTFLFTQAQTIVHEVYETGIGSGIRSRFSDFCLEGKRLSYQFETLIWIEASSGQIYFEWIPLQENDICVKRIYWPGEMAFDTPKDSWYTLIPQRQGLLIPNTWETAFTKIDFDGFFGTAGAYMPWFGQIKDRSGYLAVCETPWNAGYYLEHPEYGPYTHVGVYYEPSLGQMEYRRVLRYTLLEDCDYNTLCKCYRSFVKEQGRLRTLNEKAIANPSINDLIGCAFLHKGIKTQVQSNSDFYDPQAPEKNNHLTTFQQREQEIRTLHELGAGKLYLHLDGWAEPGYDNNHPDYFPACEKAGGWSDLKSLSDTMQQQGDLFGIHDQYRDYYESADSYDENYACRLSDGTIPKHQRWAGGPQSYLCATQAPYYVKRNFQRLKEQGIRLDGAYLDVFTCNEGDECNNPEHRMTRKDCYGFRQRCFWYLLSQDILSSSEEASDWAIPSLVFCHYAPYEFMMRKPGAPREGIAVPLYNLVYHDCLIEPWMMEQVSDQEDYMLYALLNGGAPYLVRDPAYLGIDGAYGENGNLSMEEKIKRCHIVSTLHEKVAACEMIAHHMIDADPMIQETQFSNGIRVRVDLRAQTYEIKE